MPQFHHVGIILQSFWARNKVQMVPGFDISINGIFPVYVFAKRLLLHTLKGTLLIRWHEGITALLEICWLHIHVVLHHIPKVTAPLGLRPGDCGRHLSSVNSLSCDGHGQQQCSQLFFQSSVVQV